MISLAKLSVRRPRIALLGWLVGAAVLTAIGFGVSSTLSPSVTVVPHTQSWRANQLATQQFGPSQLVPVLLEGPKSQLDALGPRLVGVLMKRPHTRVLSAWDVGAASTGLRPHPNTAMIIVSVDRVEKDVVKYDQPQIERLVTAKVAGTPVKAYITGQPSIDRAVKDASLDNLRRTELIAIGVLFVLLLIGLRAPVAAFVVAATGLLSMLSAFGEVAILGKLMKTDAVGVAAGSMTGLALSVAFALLILDRFHREEYPEGRDPRDVATAALRGLESMGKAVLVGGTGIVIALLLVAVVGPTELLVSVGTGATTCAMFAIGGAVVVMPAAFVLLGRRIDWLSFPAPRPLSRAWAALVGGGNWVTRHAIYAGFAATALLAALAVPALGLKSGQLSAGVLPADSNARIAFEKVSKVMGPGWPTQYNIIIQAHGRPITTPAMLASIDTLQRKIALNGSVASVQGPGLINAQAVQLKKFGPSLAHSAAISKSSKKDLLKLIAGLGQAGAGSKELQAGLTKAVSGADQLHSGSGAAHAGSVALHNGLMQASSGSVQLDNGLNTALAGANALKNGSAQALSGALQLKEGSSQALAGTNQLVQGVHLAQGPAGVSLGALDTLSNIASTANSQATAAANQAKAVPGSVAAAISALRSLPPSAAVNSAIATLQQAESAASAAAGSMETAASTAIKSAYISGQLNNQAPGLMAAINMLHDGSGQLADGINQLRDGNAKLAGGIDQLASGNSQLAGGMDQLAGGGGQLRNGLGQLTSGAGQLEGGLALLNAGTGQLATGLQPAPAGAGAIANGLGIMQAAVVKARGQVPSTKDLETLFQKSPGMFKSGYFVLAAVEGARGSDRNAATFTVNLLNGGTTGQIMVASKYASSDPRSIALHNALIQMGATFAKTNNAAVAVGGPGGSLTDLTAATKDRIPLMIAAIAVSLGLMLIVALRSILLPIVTIALNLLVVAAAFGIVELLFGGSNPPLGGTGSLDPVSIASIFTVAFGISVLFSTLLLMSTREAYVAGQTGREAVNHGLRLTAAAGTGAGIVMVAAMIPFATSELIIVRELGVGVGAAVLIDVLLFRPVLLPAAEAVLGRFGWWPTKGGPPREKSPETQKTRRLPRLPIRHGRHAPRPAHH